MGNGATLGAFAAVVVVGGANYIAVKDTVDELDPLYGAALLLRARLPDLLRDPRHPPDPATARTGAGGSGALRPARVRTAYALLYIALGRAQRRRRLGAHGDGALADAHARSRERTSSSPPADWSGARWRSAASLSCRCTRSAWTCRSGICSPRSSRRLRSRSRPSSPSTFRARIQSRRTRSGCSPARRCSSRRHWPGASRGPFRRRGTRGWPWRGRRGRLGRDVLALPARHP